VYAIDSAFVLYDIETRQRESVIFAINVYWMRADKRNKLVTAGFYINVWQILDSENYQEIWKLPDYKDFYNSLTSGGKAEISLDGKKLVIAGANTQRNFVIDDTHGLEPIISNADTGQVFIYDLEQNTVIQTLDEAPVEASWISWSNNLRYLVVIGANYQGVYIWNLETRERILTDFYNSETQGCLSFCFHPSGEYFAVGTFVGYVSIERICDGGTVYSERIHSSRVWSLAFTPDGKQLISGGYNRFVCILDLEGII
jgi:WD40 repeat protein